MTSQSITGAGLCSLQEHSYLLVEGRIEAKSPNQLIKAPPSSEVLTCMETHWQQLMAGKKITKIFNTGAPGLIRSAFSQISPLRAKISDKTRITFSEWNRNKTGYAGTLDFDGDGKADAKFIVVNQPGGFLRYYFPIEVKKSTKS